MNMCDENKESHHFYLTIHKSDQPKLHFFAFYAFKIRGITCFGNQNKTSNTLLRKLFRKSSVHFCDWVFSCWEKSQVFVFQCYSCFLCANRIKYIAGKNPKFLFFSVTAVFYVPIRYNT